MSRHRLWKRWIPIWPVHTIMWHWLTWIMLFVRVSDYLLWLAAGLKSHRERSSQRLQLGPTAYKADALPLSHRPLPIAQQEIQYQVNKSHLKKASIYMLGKINQWWLPSVFLPCAFLKGIFLSLVTVLPTGAYIETNTKYHFSYNAVLHFLEY